MDNFQEKLISFDTAKYFKTLFVSLNKLGKRNFAFEK